MHTSRKLLVLLLISLYGCQPETSAQSPAAPAITEQAGQPAPGKMATKTDSIPAIAEVIPEEMSPVSETDALQLAKKNNCFACHAVAKKVVGPSFKQVAAKYRGNPEAETQLMDKIAKGGSGVWGVMVMPPSPGISETDRRILAKFVLSAE